MGKTRPDIYTPKLGWLIFSGSIFASLEVTGSNQSKKPLPVVVAR